MRLCLLDSDLPHSVARDICDETGLVLTCYLKHTPMPGAPKRAGRMRGPALLLKVDHAISEPVLRDLPLKASACDRSG